MKLTTLDRVIFTIVAILAVVVLLLVLFGCSGSSEFSADAGLDAGLDAGETDTPDASGEDDAGPDAAVEPEPDAGSDAGPDTEPDAGNPCPFACSTLELCAEMNGDVVEHDCPTIYQVEYVCCHLEYWPDAGV